MAPILGIYASQISGHLFAPSGAYDSIATVTVGSGGASSVSFTSIPSTYTHLQIRGIARSTNAGTGLNLINYRFNSDSGSVYSGHSLYGTGSSAQATAQTSMNYGWAGRTSTPRTGNGASVFSGFVIDVLDYASTNKQKTVRTLSGSNNNGTSDAVELCSSLYFPASITAVNRIDFYEETANFAEYTQFALYGIKGN